MSSNNPAHPDNNRHHTETYRSYEDWANSNLSDAPTGEPSMWEPGELEASNAALQASYDKPINWQELDEWSDMIDNQIANLKGRVVGSATKSQP